MCNKYLYIRFTPTYVATYPTSSPELKPLLLFGLYFCSVRVLRVARIHGRQLYVEKTETRHIEKHINGTGERWHRGHETVRRKSTLVAGHTSQRGNYTVQQLIVVVDQTRYIIWQYEFNIKMVEVICGAVIYWYIAIPIIIHIIII